MEFVLLAPGPSMSRDLAESMRGQRVGVVSNVFELAPWADFLAANDRAWWRAYPEAINFAGRRFSSSEFPGVERCRPGNTQWASGVLALQAAVNLGAKRIRLYGFDMHGSHYFGEYTNGLVNTKPYRRAVHLQQFRDWARANPRVEVVNCTPGSALDCFPMEAV